MVKNFRNNPRPSAQIAGSSHKKYFHNRPFYSCLLGCSSCCDVLQDFINLTNVDVGVDDTAFEWQQGWR